MPDGDRKKSLSYCRSAAAGYDKLFPGIQQKGDPVCRYFAMKEAIEIAKRFVIIANGEMTDYQWHRRLLRDDDFLVCADGGARHALGMGVIPDVVLGDFD